MLFHQKKESIIKARTILDKLSKLDNLTLDHKNQNLKDKFYDNLIYTENPLRKEREEDIEDICRLNTQQELLKIRNEEILEQKKKYGDANRRLLNQVGKIQDRIEMIDRAVNDINFAQDKRRVTKLFTTLLVAGGESDSYEVSDVDISDGTSDDLI